MKAAVCHSRQSESAAASRRGLVLVVVMVVVTMISLAGFKFVASMSSENKSVHWRGEQLQMEYALASAEDFLKQFLQRDVSKSDSLEASSAQPEEDEETQMRGIVVSDDGGPLSRVRFTVLAAHYDDAGFTPWRYGLEPESTRLDLRSVVEWDRARPGAGRQALLGLPGMTEAIADAILDWIDADSTSRSSGAEQDYYSTLNPPYSPRNGFPESLEELLLIKGVTRSLLFGRDINQNHRLDPEEMSAASSTGARDVSGERQIPWSELLTLYSGERNQTRTDEPRINLNDFDLLKLHQKLSLALDENAATYIVLFRQFGPALGNLPGVDVATVKPILTNPPRFFLRTPLDLLQSRVQMSGTTSTIVNSPFPTEREKLDETLATFYDRLTTQSSPILRGRVNVNLAPAEVLRCLPGLDKALADQIVAARSSGSKGDQRHDKHPYWLLTEGIIDVRKMSNLSAYLTVGGDVHRAQIVAFSEASRLSQRAEIVLDASRAPTRRVFWKNLQVLGRGYPWDVLDTPGGNSANQSGAFDATFSGN